MPKTYKPEGYNSVLVYIMAHGAQRVINFLGAAFDAQPQRRFDRPDGALAHAEVLIDDTIVMLAEATVDSPALPVWLHVYVPDVNAAYERALKAGGVSVQPPAQRPGDTDRRAGVKDPAGNTWWIGTQVE